MKSHKLSIIIIFVVLFSTSSIFADVVLDFKQANNFYEQKKFDSAIAIYERILSGNIESSEIYFNLANSYFKNGELGYAILNYYRANRLNPDDEDIINNLEFAKNYIQVQMEGVALNPISNFFESLVALYKLNELAWFSSLIFIIMVLILILRNGLRYTGSLTKSLFIISLILFILIGSLTTYKYQIDYLTKRGVIISDTNSTIYTGPSKQSDIELEGASGMVFEIISETSNYYNVLLENKRRGWIKKEFVAVI